MPPSFIYFDLGNVLLHYDEELVSRQLAEVAGTSVERIKKPLDLQPTGTHIFPLIPREQALVHLSGFREFTLADIERLAELFQTPTQIVFAGFFHRSSFFVSEVDLTLRGPLGCSCLLASN